MNNLLPLILFFASIFFSVAYLVEMKAFSYRKEERYLLRNSFPPEFHRVMKLPVRILVMATLFLSVFASIWGISVYLFSMESLYFMLVAIGYLIGSASLFLTHVTSLENYKLHIIFALVALVFYAFPSILVGLSFIIGEGAIALDGSMNLVITIVIGVIGFIAFLLLFNPKLALWAKMEKSEDNGKTIYVRPKINFLCVYEWMAVIETALIDLLFAINILVTNP